MDTPNNDKSPKGQLLKETVRKNKFFTIVLVALVIALPLITITEVNKVEAGTATSERVIFPIGTIYNSLGYWPAVLFLPVCMLAFATFIIVRFVLPRRK